MYIYEIRLSIRVFVVAVAVVVVVAAAVVVVAVVVVIVVVVVVYPTVGHQQVDHLKIIALAEELNIFTLLKQHYWLLETGEHLVWFHFTKFQLNTSSISVTVWKHLNNFSQRPLNTGCICISKQHKVLKFKNGLEILLSFFFFEQMQKLFCPS